MYSEFYALRENPFSLLPDPDFLFLSEKHATALNLLELAVLDRSGFCTISGEIGTGKTTLIRELLNRLDSRVRVGLISNTHFTFVELLEWILAAYGLKANSDDAISLHQQFTAFISEQYASGKRTLLIIDEAQNLSLSALEELRMLCNVNSGKDLLLQIILIGQRELRDKLQKPELEQFAQRIALNYHLAALDEKETGAYIKHRLNRAGGSDSLFDGEALRLIYQYSKGIPRLINRLCGLGLVYGFSENLHVINANVIKAVSDDQIPANTMAILGKSLDRVSQPASNHNLLTAPENASYKQMTGSAAKAEETRSAETVDKNNYPEQTGVKHMKDTPEQDASVEEQQETAVAPSNQTDTDHSVEEETGKPVPETAAALSADAEKVAAETARADGIVAEKAAITMAATEKVAADASSNEVDTGHSVEEETDKPVPETAAALSADAEKATAERARADEIAAEKAAIAKAAAEKAAAERAAAEKVEAERLAAEKATAENTIADSRAAELADASRTAAEAAEAERLTAEKVAAEKDDEAKLAAEKVIAEKQAEEKAVAEKAGIEKVAMEEAAVAKAAAEKALAERIAAERAANEAAAAADAAVEKALAERVAVEKAAASRVAAAQATAEHTQAEQAAARRVAKENADVEKAAIEKAQEAESAAQRAAAEKAAAAKAAEEKAAAATQARASSEASQAAAEQALAKQMAAEKAAAAKATEEKVALAKVAANIAAAAKQAAEQAAVVKAAAEKDAREKEAAAIAAAKKAAEAASAAAEQVTAAEGEVKSEVADVPATHKKPDTIAPTLSKPRSTETQKQEPVSPVQHFSRRTLTWAFMTFTVVTVGTVWLITQHANIGNILEAVVVAPDQESPKEQPKDAGHEPVTEAAALEVVETVKKSE